MRPIARCFALITTILVTGVSAEPPNVLFILVDDWGYADAGVLGSDFFETPHIDRFASESLQFTQAYAAAPVCSPTRAAILTGKSPATLDITIWHEGAVAGGPKDRKLLEATAQPNLPREEITLAELFKKHGYATAHIGKWHLGKAAYYPETQGYDINIGGTYWGAPATFFYPYRGVWSASDPELRYVPVGAGQPGDYLTDRLTDHAVESIRAVDDQPFFLSLWYHTVHTPIEGKPRWVEKFQQKPPGKNHQHVEYAAMLASLDENVGRLLQQLKSSGLAENTVVILTSDNGGVDFPTGKSGDQPPTKNVPFRAGKGTLYEGGIRVPLMIRWPGITPARVCEVPVISQDFLPTLATGLELDRIPLPAHEGQNLFPLLRDPDATLADRQLYWHYPHYYPRMTPGSAIRDGRWKLIHYYENDRVELYDLAADPGELHDLSEVERDRTAELRASLDHWRMRVAANQPMINIEY